MSDPEPKQKSNVIFLRPKQDAQTFYSGPRTADSVDILNALDANSAANRELAKALETLAVAVYSLQEKSLTAEDAQVIQRAIPSEDWEADLRDVFGALRNSGLNDEDFAVE